MAGTNRCAIIRGTWRAGNPALLSGANATNITYAFGAVFGDERFVSLTVRW